MRPGREGFSLIEALVALAIAAMMLTAIFELQQQMIRGQRRAADVLEQVAAQENALALTRDLNPMEQPQGTVELPDGDVIRWTSDAKTEARVNAGFPTGDGQFQVQLFTVTVEIERRNGRSPAPLVFDRMGWRRMTGEGA
jgi:prepilin-type N-terminal cleavage/methylation domain-containing protein